MQFFRTHRRVVAVLALAGMALSTLYVPAVQAGMVGTDEVLAAQGAADARNQIAATLARADLREAFLARGVAPEAVSARVEALSDDEARDLAARLDSLPAGAGVLELLVLVFLVLLFTDILGLTDVFPFVKKPHRR